MRIKIEINTREHFSFFEMEPKAFSIKSPWASGDSMIMTYRLEELLATKLRALYQRKKGRDLFDFWCFFQEKAAIDWKSVVNCFTFYMSKEGSSITRAMFEENLLLKMDQPSFTGDVTPLVTPEKMRAYNPDQASQMLLTKVIALLPGEPWQGSVV